MQGVFLLHIKVKLCIVNYNNTIQWMEYRNMKELIDVTPFCLCIPASLSLKIVKKYFFITLCFMGNIKTSRLNKHKLYKLSWALEGLINNATIIEIGYSSYKVTAILWSYTTYTYINWWEINGLEPLRV